MQLLFLRRFANLEQIQCLLAVGHILICAVRGEASDLLSVRLFVMRDCDVLFKADGGVGLAAIEHDGSRESLTRTR